MTTPVTAAILANTNGPELNTTVNYTNSTAAPELENRFLLPWWQQTIFILAFAAIFLVASCGNVIVVWIVLAHKNMRTVTNYFLVNLAIADFMISVLNMLFTFAYLLYQDWWFGYFFCKCSWFISPCTISVSVLTFMAIAVDRYMAIMYPLRPRLPKRHVIAAIVVIWAVSIAIAFPNLLYAETYGIAGHAGVVCSLTWSNGEDLAYSYLLLVFHYAFPLVTLTVTYTRVGVELWGSRAIGEDTAVQMERVKSKRKVVKMMIVVVVIFAICWLPTHVYFLLASHYPSVMELEYIQQIYIVIFLMAMSNPMYNPIIYCWMNSRFREGFISVFCWCPCRPCKDVRSHLRFRRTLFPARVTTMSDKYGERNGSLVHTMTEYVDTDGNGVRRSAKPTDNNRIMSKNRKAEDYV